MNNKFKGTGVALITPFNDDHSIDYKSFEMLLDDLLINGINYFVALGTTSEASTLNNDEKLKVVETIKKINNKQIPLVVGIGGNNTDEVIINTKKYNFEDIDAILSVVPYYTRPQQEGLYQHFIKIADISPRPIILYNVPSRTSVNLEPETTLRLAEHKNIIAIKEASGIMNQIMKIIKYKPKDFLVISGDDAITLPIIAAGGDGVISVVANAYPKIFSQMVKYSLMNDYDNSRKLHYKLLDIIQACFKDGSPAGVKAFLTAQGKIKNQLRLPLVKVNNEIERYIFDNYLVS